MHIIEGNIIDVEKDMIYPGSIKFDEKIVEIRENGKKYDNYICPGYIDPHIHIESTMLTPSLFSNVVASHGTSAVVADPHEIANVLGMDGIDFMVEDSRSALIDVYFTAPSCVPATRFETAGAILGPPEIDELLKRNEFVALGEMMNYPGVVGGDPSCMEKILSARRAGKPIDGHCPGLSGRDLKRYVEAGISTEHECTSLQEAKEKMSAGMKILIREGSSAKNLKALIGLKDAFSFCTDDKHVGDLIELGHMDHILKMAVEHGKDPVDAIKMVTFNPAEHYSLASGRMRVGETANLLVLDRLDAFTPSKTYFHGELVSNNGELLRKAAPSKRSIGHMSARMIDIVDLEVQKNYMDHIICAVDEDLVTGHLSKDDIGDELTQKIVVVDRHRGGGLSVALVAGLQMKDCAIAQSISHDSHNIVATGSHDVLIVKAVNRLIGLGGGIVACSPTESIDVPLEIAGLMSTRDPHAIAGQMENLRRFLSVHENKNEALVTTLSFMALLVIPHLKLSDMGLFDVDSFEFIGND